MPAYEIGLRFRDLTLSLSTTDAALADRTTMRWLESLAGVKAGTLASSQILASSQPVASVALPTITPPLDVTSVPVATTILPEPEVLPVALPDASTAVLLPPEELPPIRMPEDGVPSAPEAISSASALEPEIIQVSASEPPPPVDDPVNDFEAVMDSMMRDLEANDLPPSETSEAPEAPEAERPSGTTESLEIEADPTSEPPERIQEIPQEEITQEEPPQENGFEAILESVPQSALATLPTGPPVRQVTDLRFIDSLTDLVEQAKPQTMEESLLLTSYYLTFFDATERFTLKHINNLLVKGGYPPVNHGVIEAAIDRGYLAVVPDLTGTAEMTEYQLSDAGQTFTERLL